MCRQLNSYNGFLLEKVIMWGSGGIDGLALPVLPWRVRRGRANPALDAFRKHRCFPKASFCQQLGTGKGVLGGKKKQQEVSEVAGQA